MDGRDIVERSLHTTWISSCIHIRKTLIISFWIVSRSNISCNLTVSYEIHSNHFIHVSEEKDDTAKCKSGRMSDIRLNNQYSPCYIFHPFHVDFFLRIFVAPFSSGKEMHIDYNPIPYYILKHIIILAL